MERRGARGFGLPAGQREAEARGRSCDDRAGSEVPQALSSSRRLSKTQRMHSPLISDFQRKGLESGNWEECEVADAAGSGLTSVRGRNWALDGSCQFYGSRRSFTMCDTRDCGFTALPGLIWKTSVPGSEPPNNYFLFFPVYDVNKPPSQKPVQPALGLGRGLSLQLIWAALGTQVAS